jgi:hypothetical protein
MEERNKIVEWNKDFFHQNNTLTHTCEAKKNNKKRVKEVKGTKLAMCVRGWKEMKE